MRRWSSRWPAWCAVSKRCAPREGDTIAIIGLGPIGLMFVKLAKLYGCRVIAVGRRQTQLDRAAALGADELVVAGERFRSGEGDSRPDARARRGYRHRSRRQAADLGMGRQHGAPRRHRELLRRLPQRQHGQPGYRPAALLRNHLQGQLPPHAGATSGRRSTWCAPATSRPRSSSTAKSRWPTCWK